jgi:hypothetical protein
MRDQSHDRINGSAAAAFATICERRLNMASVLKSAGEFRRRVVVKSRMRRRFKIRQEIGANYFSNEVVFFAPFRGVDAGQPPQDIKDSSRSRPFTLTPRITEKRNRQATSSTTFCFVHADRSTTSSLTRSLRLNAGSLVCPTVHRCIAARN